MGCWFVKLIRCSYKLKKRNQGVVYAKSSDNFIDLYDQTVYHAFIMSSEIQDSSFS
jgi:hypothetical protein